MDEFYSQIFNTINIGVVVLDKEFSVRQWNRWMEQTSSIPFHKAIGTSIFDHFPGLDNGNFRKKCASVLSFGNVCFLCEGSVFPVRTISTLESDFDLMMQSCSIGPLRDEEGRIEHVYIAIYDITEVVAEERRLNVLNTKDGLTGVYNRSFLESRLEEEVKRHKRYQRPLSVMMLDLDFFKRINDTYGHQFGDTVLKSVASLATGGIRGSDCLCRYGGEEFCCLLPETDSGSAMALAERLRRTVEEARFSFHEISVKATVSIGISTLANGDDAFTLMKKADEALYEAKKTGRNKAVFVSSIGKAQGE